jgi:hypothetical protein
MKKLLAIFLLLASSAIAQNPTMEDTLGMKWTNGNDYGLFTYNLDAADSGDSDSCSDDVFAISINPAKTCTIDKFRLLINSKAGTIGATDMVAALKASSAGAPSGADIASYNTLTTALTGGMFIEWAGFNDSVTRSVQHWIVVKNCNATPGTNYPIIVRDANALSPSRYIGEYGTGDSYRCSNDGGATWAACSGASKPPGFVVECAEGFSFGWPIELQSGAAASSSGGAKKAYDVNEVGFMFTTPADAKLKILGVTCDIAKQGTPTGAVKYRLYNGTTHVADTDTMSAANMVTSGGHRRLFFSSAQELAANTSYRISVASLGAGDSSSNAYGLGYVTFENDAESLALKPFGGTMQYTAYNGSSWSQTAAQTPLCSVILDNSDYFGTQAGGGPVGGKLNNGQN